MQQTTDRNNSKTKPIILLDRDGVINYDSDAYIKSVDEWQPLPGSIKAIAALSKAGFRIFVVTNQSGIARGYYDETELNAMHTKMLNLVHSEGGTIEGIEYCPHGPDDGCHCRKPLPGMIETIESKIGVDFTQTSAIIVGDSKRDLEAGHARGCHPSLVLTGKGRDTQYKAFDFYFDVYADLAAFALATLHKFN
ncbi:D-glycero-beta-D-manno-heptose 1,7-bisphosphate 7-phosphatase [Marinomonas mediterranea]|nr:D-glycero-beta-D-manno-heptose 1,7-bisphosphate 7-phosphatase [Marinomonas mediterranea]WCN11317.1 D-glycero-beta-D-manno-heptose 1,7-bisphosphate 7-phosphatase [Marinomonas mediterranea]WCN15382.1 D-glycero-beta-D-manno-heptose 1,7-bisphosphate 7-phosphatase [Marinomonas mediterranea]WCN19422.1 D-glycero-beta-D-manno-heptose 1,7-bisphosphate 7-phosphatase [Marinomonas mediterranea MMB-1]